MQIIIQHSNCSYTTRKSNYKQISRPLKCTALGKKNPHRLNVRYINSCTNVTRITCQDNVADFRCFNMSCSRLQVVAAWQLLDRNCSLVMKSGSAFQMTVASKMLMWHFVFPVCVEKHRLFHQPLQSTPWSCHTRPWCSCSVLFPLYLLGGFVLCG